MNNWIEFPRLVSFVVVCVLHVGCSKGRAVPSEAGSGHYSGHAYIYNIERGAVSHLIIFNREVKDARKGSWGGSEVEFETPEGIEFRMIYGRESAGVWIDGALYSFEDGRLFFVLLEERGNKVSQHDLPLGMPSPDDSNFIEHLVASILKIVRIGCEMLEVHDTDGAK